MVARVALTLATKMTNCLPEGLSKDLKSLFLKSAPTTELEIQHLAATVQSPAEGFAATKLMNRHGLVVPYILCTLQHRRMLLLNTCHSAPLQLTSGKPRSHNCTHNLTGAVLNRQQLQLSWQGHSTHTPFRRMKMLVDFVLRGTTQ
jgi:hypothetical protein